MRDRHRVIVVGCGAIGAATTYWLSTRLGTGVLALEQFELGHALGASEDHSRIIRHAYSQATYTALTAAAFESWAIAERETGLALVHRTGGLIIADQEAEDASFLVQAADAMTEHGRRFEELTANQVMRRWPQWRLGDRHRALYDLEAGILDIRRGTAAHVALARGNGAAVVPSAPVTAIAETPDGVRVTAAGETYVADRVVLAGGAWNPELLAMLGTSLPIRLTEEQVTYFATPNVRDFVPERFPIFGFIEHDNSLFYGFPVYGEVATKAGIDASGPTVTPATRTYAADRERVDRVARFLETYVPGAVGPELYTRVCCYDVPPDRDFIVDRLPDHSRVLVCAGAGHAGKFAALLGRILTHLALDEDGPFPIEAFRADRPWAEGPGRTNSM